MIPRPQRPVPGPARIAALALALALASPTARGEEPADEGWLEGGEAPADPADPGPKGDQSFGAELDFLGLEISWSGYGDIIASYTPGALTYDAYHFNPILGARLSRDLWAELELEFEHGGSEILVEYGLLDFTPRPELSLRVGQFLVPVGEFNDTFHPSFRWSQVTRPQMFKDVVPAVWSDIGAQVFGRVGTGGSSALYYNLFTVNGLGGDAIDLGADYPIRELRGNVQDNNIDKAFGGRARIALGEGRRVGAFSLSVSAYTGELLAVPDQRFTIADAALRLALGPVSVQGELAQNFLGRGDDALTPFERGAYVQVKGVSGKANVSGRYDFVDGNVGERHVVAAGGGYQVRTFWNVRGEVAWPVVSSTPEERTLPDMSLMSAFYF